MDSEFEIVRKALAEQEASIVAKEKAAQEARAEWEAAKLAFQRVVAIRDNATLGKPLDFSLIHDHAPIRNGTSGGLVEKAVARAVRTLQGRGPFTSADIFQQWENEEIISPIGFSLKGNRANIPRYLQGLVDKGVIRVKEKGAGRKPSTFSHK